MAFTSAQQWVARLAAAKRAGRLDDELERIGRLPLIVVDEVGHIPFDPEAVALFFALVSSRYERSSIIVSSISIRPALTSRSVGAADTFTPKPRLIV